MKFIVSLALFAGAVVAQVGSSSIAASQCDASHLQCCDTVGPTTNSAVSKLLALLNIPLDGLTGEIGLECDPILSVTVPHCEAQPVCCEGNKHDGLVNVDCVPVNLDL
ncbi:fungal hydrophobin-domain-containing protein [Talaromyces proteolyticus]|uniref:Hydrophobin n=1 Tax=Talaromyces proteolyticus TaxID=1131652 RepID=A0AAD4KGS0_9EURO|nr:fungal hydrophobin-domain-containing protein [Talaromyces proteolyticus]KAH8690723.1 fungal hydrophobin-domain-containing protein [Talaromyces proteolyticus]